MLEVAHRCPANGVGLIPSAICGGDNDAQAATAAGQLASTMSLTGNTAGAIANRASILGLVTNYQGYLAALASSGASQDVLKAKSAELKTEFLNQATQAGFSRGEIDLYAVSFDDMTTAIGHVPRNITVDANPNPALAALAEFDAAAVAAEQRGVDVPIRASNAGQAGADAARDFTAAFRTGAGPSAVGPLKSGYVLNEGYGASSKSTSRLSGGGLNGQDGNFFTDLWDKFGTSGWYADGGYTGDGARMEPAGVVHKGEYVFSKKATENIGVNKLARLHSTGKSGRGYANGGLVGGGTGSGSMSSAPVDLSAGTIMAVAQAVSQINLALYTDDRAIAQSANRGSVQLAFGGSN